MQGPFQQRVQAIDLIRHFTPNWFTVSMGTGVVSLVIAELPIQHELVWALGQILWQLNILLFVLFSTLYLARWLLFYQEAKQIFQHPMMCLFLGTIPMALATILNGVLKYAQPLYGDIAVNIATLLWYVDVVLAILIAWIVPFAMYQYQQHSLKTMTAVWLLPIVACEVAAASGGLLLAQLEAGQQAVQILLFSYVLWGMSVLPAFAILTMLMLRLVVHQLPDKTLAMSNWLALGPIGTGALALLLLGKEAPRVLQSIDLLAVGDMLHALGIVGALILLGFGLWWLGIAAFTTWHHVQKELPFNLGWWALTFPLGVFSLAVLNLAEQFNVAVIYTVAYSLMTVLILLWCMVSVKTVQGFYRGQLLFSPCLNSYLEKQALQNKA